MAGLTLARGYAPPPAPCPCPYDCRGGVDLRTQVGSGCARRSVTGAWPVDRRVLPVRWRLRGRLCLADCSQLPHHPTPQGGDGPPAAREGRAVHTRVWTVASRHRLSASLLLWHCVLTALTRGDPEAGGAPGGGPRGDALRGGRAGGAVSRARLHSEHHSVSPQGGIPVPLLGSNSHCHHLRRLAVPRAGPWRKRPMACGKGAGRTSPPARGVACPAGTAQTH